MFAKRNAHARLGVFCALASFFCVGAAAAPAKFGRYVGTLRHEALGRDQLAKLDFIPSREEGDTVRLKAVLTLGFGDFSNAEYVAYHFDDVRFDVRTQKYIFDQSDQAVTLVGRQVSEHEFTGELRSAFDGDLHQLVLRDDEKPVKPELPLIEPIWGEYRGKCQGKIVTKPVDTIVQLYTYRSNEGAAQVGDPFRAYKIRGEIGELHPNRPPCDVEGGTGHCLWGNITGGSYNFFKKELLIFNNYRNLTCTTEANGIHCNGCEPLLRVSKETKEPRVYTPIASTPAFPAANGTGPAVAGSDLDSLQGEYLGYLHHEYLNTYQVARLNILTYQASAATGQPSTLRMSAVATLNFGGEKSTERLSYRFDERGFANPLLATQFVFSQTTGDVDAILRITSIGKGTVRGVWFSQLFGRVGTFELHKGPLAPAPSGKPVMEELGGHYENHFEEFEFLVGLGTAPPNTEDPFAPLRIGGWNLVFNITAKRPFTGSSFDFYTGRFGVEIGDKTSYVGQRPGRRKIYLRQLYHGVTAPLLPFALGAARLSSEEN